MGLFNKVEMNYTGKVGSVVRIPCKRNSDKWFFNGTGKEYKILKALMGGRDKKPMDMFYFGFQPTDDESEGSYTSGYTATSTGGGQYSVKANRTHFGDAIALKVVVGTDEKVAKDKKSNVNKWLRAVSKPARGFWYHIFGLLTTPIIIGFFMLGSAIYRDYLNVVRKSCVKKAKKTYKMCEEVVVF